MARAITLEIVVTVPDTVGENEVETAINAALDEPPCDWEIWTVGAAIIKNVERVDNSELNDMARAMMEIEEEESEG